MGRHLVGRHGLSAGDDEGPTFSVGFRSGKVSRPGRGGGLRTLVVFVLVGRVDTGGILDDGLGPSPLRLQQFSEIDRMFSGPNSRSSFVACRPNSFFADLAFETFWGYRSQHTPGHRWEKLGTEV